MTLLVVAVGAIALAIVEADSPNWTRTELVGAVGTGLIALVGFVVWARNARDPLVELGLFRHRTYSAVNAATLTFGIAFAMMFFALFFYMGQDVLAADLVVQRVEAVTGFGLRFRV